MAPSVWSVRTCSAGEQRLHSQAGDLGELLGHLDALAGVVVGEPSIQLGGHLLSAAARGADEEDVAEAALVRRVAGAQGVLRRGVGGPDGGLLSAQSSARAARSTVSSRESTSE